MNKPGNSLNQAFVIAFLVIGSVAVAAVIFNYSGNLQLKFGPDGIQLQIKGQQDSKRLK